MAAEPDFKGLLQSHCQKAKLGLPQYTCVQTSKRNRAFFIARVTVMGKEFSSEAEFSSKKQAEKNAAKVALFQLRILSTAKLNNYSSCGPANIASGPRPDTDNWYELNEGQVFSETSSVLGETPDKSHKEDFSAPVLPSEGEGTLKVAAPEDERPLLSAITSDLVPGKSNAPLSYKNILQEKAQKMGQSLPHYETTREADGFVCTVIFNGQSFKSDGCSPNKKMAQQNAASRAIQVLTGEQTQKETLLSGIQTVPTISPSAAIEVGNILSYKNLLQENCQQRGHRCPSYSTSWQGSGFVSVVQVGDKTVSSKASYETKKRAEQMAAREALLLAGVHKPEDAYKNSQERKGKLKRNFDPEEEFNRTSLVHCHGGYGMGYPNLCRSEADYSWEKGIVSKRLKLDTSECHANFGGNNEARTINLPQDYRRDFTVAEIWKEKKNIVIIGHEETSFVLYCTIIPGTCNLFNNHTKSLILLQPGKHIFLSLIRVYSNNKYLLFCSQYPCTDKDNCQFHFIHN